MNKFLMILIGITLTSQIAEAKRSKAYWVKKRTVKIQRKVKKSKLLTANQFVALSLSQRAHYIRLLRGFTSTIESHNHKRKHASLKADPPIFTQILIAKAFASEGDVTCGFGGNVITTRKSNNGSVICSYANMDPDQAKYLKCSINGIGKNDGIRCSPFLYGFEREVPTLPTTDDQIKAFYYSAQCVKRAKNTSDICLKKAKSPAEVAESLTKFLVNSNEEIKDGFDLEALEIVDYCNQKNLMAYQVEDCNKWMARLEKIKIELCDPAQVDQLPELCNGYTRPRKPTSQLIRTGYSCNGRTQTLLKKTQSDKITLTVGENNLNHVTCTLSDPNNEPLQNELLALMKNKNLICSQEKASTRATTRGIGE